MALGEISVAMCKFCLMFGREQHVQISQFDTKAVLMYCCTTGVQYRVLLNFSDIKSKIPEVAFSLPVADK